MNKIIKKTITVLLSIAMVVGIVFTTPYQGKAIAAQNYEGKLVILHTNDMHGRYMTDTDEGILGMSAVRALKGFYEKQGASVLLLDAGDFSQGNNLVNYFKGIDAVYFMNAAGYDAGTLGNHEFDFGFEAVKSIISTASFDILAANVTNKETGKPLAGDRTVFDLGKYKVGIFGLSTPETQTSSAPNNVKSLSFLSNEELYNCAQQQVNALKADGCNYIIGIGHLGIDEGSLGNRSIDIALNVEGIDLLIDGHSHSEIDGGIVVNKTKIVSTGNYLNNVGLVTFDGYTTLAKLINDVSDLGGCPSMDDFVTSYEEVVDNVYSGTFATTTNRLNGDREPGTRTEETNLGDFAADAYRYVGQLYAKENGLGYTVDAAIQNGGGIRASIDAGEISMNTLYSVFPFNNTLSIIELTGEELLEALEASCAPLPGASGGFPQVSGIKYSVDTRVAYEKGSQYPGSTYFAPANPGSRVTIESVGGKAFSKTAIYHIAVDDFIASGGDTYYVFSKAKNKIVTDTVVAEVLITYVNSLNGIIGDQYAKPAGNVTIIK